MARTYTPVAQRKPRGANKTDAKTSHRLAGLSDAEIVAEIAAYIRQTATDGKPISVNTYERTRPAELPNIGSIRISRGITWNQCVEAAGFTPREQTGGKARTQAAAPAQRQPATAAEYIARPHIVSGPGPNQATVNIYSAADAPDTPAPLPPRTGRPGRVLDPAPVWTAGDLPEPVRDAITGRLSPVLDCHGRVVARVRVFPGERTCLACGETFMIRTVRSLQGRRNGQKWIEQEIGFCPRCGIDEEGNDRRTPTPPPSVATVDYLQFGEYQKA